MPIFAFLYERKRNSGRTKTYIDAHDMRRENLSAKCLNVKYNSRMMPDS